MTNRTQFGIVIARTADYTYMATLTASKDCRFRCTTCKAKCWAIQRLRGQVSWMCSGCTTAQQNGRQPGPRQVETQPRRQLAIDERLRSPHGTWTVARSRRLSEKDERGRRNEYCTYLLTHDDGHQEEWRAREMADADFHLILPGEQQTLT